MTAQAQRTRGIGNKPPWSEQPYSRAFNNTGFIAPTQPGWVTTIEPWEALMVSGARFVTSEPFIVQYLSFIVIQAAGSNDSCDVGILDQWGDVIYHAGLIPGLLNSTGPKFHQPTSQVSIRPGRTYYSCFGYGAIGSTPATLLTACYPGALSMSGYGGSQQQFGYQDTAIWTTSDGTVKPVSSAAGAVAPYVNWGEAVLMDVRHR